MSGWAAWASNLAALRPGFRRPAGAYSMTTDDELHFLETYARFSYTGAGKIVDLGCWLGATAAALARGLMDNPHREQFAQPIDAYDQFIWREWMTPIAQAMRMPGSFREGDDFFDHARVVLQPWLPLIRLLRADLSEEQVMHDRVEFLMIDAMKSWTLANSISRSFLPELIAGQSLVVQQDFGHYHPITATNHIFMWALRDWLQPVHQVPGSTSVVFFVDRTPAKADIPWIGPENLTPEMIEEAFRYSLGFAGPGIARGIRLCKVLFLLEQSRYDAAVAAAQELVDTGGALHGTAWSDSLAMVRAWGQQTSPSDPDRTALARVRQLLGLPQE